MIEQQNPTSYELEALAAIRKWKDPEGNFLTKVGQSINKPFKWAGDLVFDNPVGEAGAKAIQGIIDLLSEGACWTVRTEAIYDRFRSKGYDFVETGEDIYKLTLGQVDPVVGYLSAKYKALAAGEGAVSGVAGWLGIAADIPALLALNLRAIGEYCTYYGFNLDTQTERMFALQVLMLTSSATDASKQAALANLTKIATEVAKKKTWEELERHAVVRGVQQAAKALGIRLTKAKLGQIIPAIGALVGGGFNAYFTSKTTQAAYYLYRERFLLARYGLSILGEDSEGIE